MATDSNRRILVVDSEDSSLSDLLTLLGQAGYAVAGTWSGVEALALLRSRKFDVLLVNDYLPDLYIGNFLGRLSRLTFRPRVVLMHDGNSIVDVRVHGSFHANAVVNKREPEHLLTILSDCFGKTRSVNVS